MDAKKWLLAVGVVILGFALFFAGTTFAQSDEDNSDREWMQMMNGEVWEHGPMHGWGYAAEKASRGASEEGAECPGYADHANHVDHMDGWEEHHGAMHGAYGDMMRDWAQPTGSPDAPAGEPGS